MGNSPRNWQPLMKALRLAVGFASACGMVCSAMAAEAPGFDAQVAPILQKNCLACHSSTARMGGLVMESYDSLLKGGAHGPPIVASNADGSRIIQMLEGKIAPRMPYGGDPLPAADIATIKAWINAGATGPAAGAPVKTLAPAALPDIHPVVAVVSPVSSLKFSPRWRTTCRGRLSRGAACRSLHRQRTRHACRSRRLRAFDCV